MKEMEKTKKTEDIKSHFEDISERYDKVILKNIPFYDEFLDALIGLIPFEKVKEIYVMDLGCGTGNLTKRIKQNYPHARIICIDISPNMIEVAKLKLKEYQDIEYLIKDFYNIKFENQYDVVLSSYSLHHLITDDDKKTFYQKIYNNLNKGGIFFNLDVVLGSNEHIQNYYMEEWKKYLREGYSKTKVQKILEQYYYEDSPAKLIDQLKWLEDIGFGKVDVIRKYFNFAIYGGIK